MHMVPLLSNQGCKTAGLTLFFVVAITATELLATDDKSATNSGNDVILTKIMSDWKHRQELTHGFRYVADGQGIIPKGKLTGDRDLGPHIKGEFPPEDLTYDENESWIIDFDTNRSRHELRTQCMMLPEGKLSPNYTVVAYDGNSDRVYTPRAENSGPNFVPPAAQPDLSDGQKASDRTLSYVWIPTFVAHGMIPEYLPLVEHPRVEITPSRFHFHAKASFMGRDCVVLRTVPDPKRGHVDELWVDVERRSAVTKFIRYRSVNDVFLLFEIQYQRDGAEWRPESWTQMVFRNKKLSQSSRRRIVQYAVNPSSGADLFNFELKPGMVYAKDMSKGELFKVGEDGKTLTKMQIPFATGDESATTGWRLWWLLLLLMPICVFAACVVWFRRRGSARN
jgi:hypothetical protein